MSTDPFAQIVDEAPLSPADARAELLTAAKRGFVPIRNVFVQKHAAKTERKSLLADFVTHRQERALDAFLLLHALQPILGGDPLPIGTWANLLSLRGTCSPTTASKTFGVLADMHLITRSRAGRNAVLTPLLEDGSGDEWFKPRSREGDSSVYFVLPHDYWTQGYAQELKLPGKAMLLIMLKETQLKPSFAMAVEKASEWYGLSERTAERGYRELNSLDLIQTHLQKVASAKLPAGATRTIWHRALRAEFSTETRKHLQAQSKERATSGINARSSKKDS